MWLLCSMTMTIVFAIMKTKKLWTTENCKKSCNPANGRVDFKTLTMDRSKNIASQYSMNSSSIQNVPQKELLHNKSQQLERGRYLT